MANELLAQKAFWQQLFRSTDLASQLAEVVKHDEENGSGTIQLPLDLKSITVRVKQATSVGDNFMSEVYFVKATTESDTFDAFVKILPTAPLLRDIALSCGIHQREMRIYKEVFPALRNLYEEAGLNPKQYLQVPDLYHFSDEDNKLILVLENFQVEGYKMADKYVGCDLAHLRCALKSLANYHAASIAYVRRLEKSDPTGMIDFLQETMAIEMGANKSLRMHLLNLTDLLRIMDHPEVADRLEQRIPSLETVLEREPFVPGQSIFCVTHGDFWVNNMLFLYNEEGLPVNTKMLDFQISRVAHPSFDIQYILTNSTASPVRKAHMGHLIGEYFEQLSTMLEKLGIRLSQEGYSEETFREEFQQRLIRLIMIACMLLPFILDRDLAERMSRPTDSSQDNVYIDDEGQLTEEAQNAFKDPTKADLLASNTVLSKRVVDLLVEAYEDGLL